MFLLIKSFQSIFDCNVINAIINVYITCRNIGISTLTKVNLTCLQR